MMPLIVMLMTLTLLFGGLRWGHAEIIGDWVVDTTSDSLVYAAATNDSGGIIGQYCEPAQGSCIWVLARFMRER
jgi:hypothetical protein